MKGSLTATSSTSSLFKATLATKRPILPNPESYKQNYQKLKTVNIILIKKSDLRRKKERSEELECLPLIPILILPEPSEIRNSKQRKKIRST
jgi:hypothetical protein